MKTFIKSCGYALEGIKTAFRQESHMKIHVMMALCVVVCGMFFHITKIEWMICLGLIALVIAMELMNTAIEATVDLFTDQRHPLAKLAKDAAAGAVLVIAFGAAIIGLMIFIPYGIHFIFS